MTDPIPTEYTIAHRGQAGVSFDALDGWTFVVPGQTRTLTLKRPLSEGMIFDFDEMDVIIVEGGPDNLPDDPRLSD